MDIGFFDDIVRAMLGFKVGFGEVFANDAKKEELNAADEHDDADEAWPARGGVAKDKGLTDDDDNDNEGDKTK